MRYAHLVHVVGIILIALAVALGFTALVAWYLGDGDAPAFVITALAGAVIGWVAYWRTQLTRDLSVREGYAVVTLAWLGVGLLGALPYLLTGTIASPVAAFFESVSGFTTTGATVFSDIESLPRGVIFWRAMTQWLGGMGIIVLGIAILPFLGVGGMQLFRAEVPGPRPERLAPRIRQTAALLWYVYGGLTAVQATLYVLGGMPVFEAVTHAFTTLSTGGFSPRNASIAAYGSPFLQYVTILFMYLAAVNFTLHYRALRGRPLYWKDPEWRFFSLVVGGATLVVLLVGLARAGLESGFEPAFRESMFQVVSIATTTGFVSADYELWPVGSQLILLMLMFMGGMAGSTGGGMKALRVYLLTRQGLDELKRQLHPQAVLPTRLGKRAVRERTMMRILAFALFFVGLFAAGTLGMALLGHDIVTSLGSSAASLGNIGPGLGEVGAVDNYGWMGAPSHLLLIFLMLAGRLEIFTVLILFHPDLWRRYGAGRGPRLRQVADWTTRGHPLAPTRARDAERLRRRSLESEARSAEEEPAQQTSEDGDDER